MLHRTSKGASLSKKLVVTAPRKLDTFVGDYVGGRRVCAVRMSVMRWYDGKFEA